MNEKTIELIKERIRKDWVNPISEEKLDKAVRARIEIWKFFLDL